ncbi:MAG: hypothetical protein IJX71_03305, partial [Oscillospiraceae bacterium]|nr:hypothetical protein [Oscillospiraceae bacterium]
SAAGSQAEYPSYFPAFCSVPLSLSLSNVEISLFSLNPPHYTRWKVLLQSLSPTFGAMDIENRFCLFLLGDIAFGPSAGMKQA